MAVQESYDFTVMSPADLPLHNFTWYNEPHSVQIEKGKGLKVVPKPKTDFWRKTYLTQPADRSSGHGLLFTAPSSLKKVTAEVSFSLTPVVQYDQAGLMVFIDENHWLKAGIEFVDGLPRMSCVVTNDMSDWGYLTWPTAEGVDVRVHLERYDTVVECLVEYRNDKGEWTFFREAGLTLGDGNKEYRVGMTCCAPKKESDEEEGMEVVFHKIVIKSQ